MVSPGALEVRKGRATLATVGLGSCVCIGLHDPIAGVGGLTHCLLPEPPGPTQGPPGRYTSTAVPLLIEKMAAFGARVERMRAWLAGGASMFPDLAPDGLAGIGARNIDAARLVLSELGIELDGEATGGSRGRSVRLEVESGQFVVRSVLQPEVVL